LRKRGRDLPICIWIICQHQIRFLGSPAYCVDLFVDVGLDDRGQRVTGTLRAEILYLQPSNKRGPARAQLMWAGSSPAASVVVNRLLTEQLASSWNSQAQLKVA